MRGSVLVLAAAGVAGGAMLTAGAAMAQLQQPLSVSMLRDGATWRPVMFVCDATNRDRVVTMSPPDAARRITLTRATKPGLAMQSVAGRLGQGDAGMSQIWYPLYTLSGRAAGNVHTVNPGVVEPGATTPTVTGVTLGTQTDNCRFAPQTRVLGVTAKRSIQVTQSARNGYRYRSYNHDANLPEITQPWGGRDTRASLTIDGGRVIDQSNGRRIYQFDNGGFVYRVLASVDPAKGGGGVQVWRDGRMVLGETFGAYTAALRP
jgi:hypothetical protein